MIFTEKTKKENGQIYEGISYRYMGSKEVIGVRYSTIRSLEKVQSPLTVVDIQTDVENFYARGILFHNCYINNGVRGYRGSGLSTVDPTYPDKIRKQMKSMKTATALYMSSFIDPFMELEPIYQNTKKTATVALDNNLPMFFLTRKKLPDWTFDYLKPNK